MGFLLVSFYKGYHQEKILCVICFLSDHPSVCCDSRAQSTTSLNIDSGLSPESCN